MKPQKEKKKPVAEIDCNEIYNIVFKIVLSVCSTAATAAAAAVDTNRCYSSRTFNLNRNGIGSCRSSRQSKGGSIGRSISRVDQYTWYVWIAPVPVEKDAPGRRKLVMMLEIEKGDRGNMKVVSGETRYR